MTLSRWGYVAIVLVPLADAAMLALLHARRRRSAAAAAAAGAILGIGAHIYLASWIVLAALLLFVLWPIEGGAAVAKRVILALALACGFALVAAPLFLFREGRQAPYFARASNQSMLRSLRSARSPLPVMASAADAIAAP